MEVDGKPTFLNVLLSHYDEIAKNWNTDTQEQYLKHYRDHIIPLLREKALIDYNTVEDFDAVIDHLRSKPKERKVGNSSQYSASTIQHYRRLIKVVLEAAARAGICPDILWGSVYSLSEMEVNAKKLERERVLLRKSLTPSEEWRMQAYLMSDCLEDGQKIGLLLMAVFGLRNEESCGVNYGDIVPSVNCPEIQCVYIFKSATGSSNQLKVGGKTRNMVRILPMPEILYQFLSDRKAHIQRLVDSGALVLGEGYQSVDELPVACHGQNWCKRCSSAQLTNAGRIMFKEIQMKEDQLAFIAEELEENVNESEMGRYKDPTAYLLRRNLATHLSVLGFPVEDIQYFMGHDIEDSSLKRGDFQYREHQKKIKERLEKRPIFGSKWNRTNTVELSEHDQYTNKNTICTRIKAPCKGQKITLRVQSKEPGEKVKMRVWIESDGVENPEATYSICTFSEDNENDDWVNVLNEYYTSYRRAKRTLNKTGECEEQQQSEMNSEGE